MMTNYPLGDFLIRIKNAAMAKIHKVEVPRTKLIEELAKLLKSEGYLSEVKKEGEKLIINLSYIKKEPTLIDIRLVSKPGLRVYKSVNDLRKYRGPSVLIVSTPKGLTTGAKALKNNLGGEVLAEVQ